MTYGTLRATVLMVTVALAATDARAASVLELRGRGVQVYRCAPVGAGFTWTLQGPDATLLTSQGEPAGRHFAGPSWQATDGSIVVGDVVASGSAAAQGGQASAIPWLVLRAKSHSGEGAFAAVTYVTRSRTVGGLAPAAGCDTAHRSAMARVPYEATYDFFGAM